MKRTYIWYGLIVIATIVSAIGGYYAGKASERTTCVAEKNLIENKVSELRTEILSLAPDQGPVFSIGGTIQEIGADTITIEMVSLGQTLSADVPVRMESRTISITDETVIVSVGYAAAPDGGLTVQETPIVFEALSVGDRVMVYADEDIKAATSFTATRVELPLMGSKSGE
jgi:hypothetical protein